MKSTTLSSVTVFLASILLCLTVSAATLKTETTTKVFENAKLVKSVTLIGDDKSESLMSHVSHGLRKKAVFGLVPVNVYVIQVLAAKPEKLVKTEEGFLASLKEAGPVQLHITFLRDLPGEKISESFKDGLKANKLDVSKLPASTESVLKEVSAITEFKEGEAFSLTFNWTGEQATVYMTDATLKIKTVSGPKEFADQLLSIWFGYTADSKLEDLKKTLIK